jgi:putative membrane protein
VDKPTTLAYERTWLAYERTMQAWIRTAISLITFGFSIYKLTDIFATPAERSRIFAAEEFGTLLVCIGLFTLAIAVVIYRQSIWVLRLEYGKSPRSLSVWVAATIAALGIFALVTMFWR